MTRSACLCLFVLAASARGDDPPPRPELDAQANHRLLDTHFCRYGFEPLKTIHRQDEWARIRLPAQTKEREVGQTGLYSYVALAGDFEVEASFGFTEVPEQKGGYGMSCGIAVDTLSPAGMVALARNFSKSRAWTGYTITIGKPPPGQNGYEYKGEPAYPTAAKTGRLAIRREKDELVCLALEPKKEWEELCRIPYTTATVRQVRIYGDTGGSASPLEVWIGAVRLRAEEITGGFAKRDRPAGVAWWQVALGLGLLTVAVWLFGRRQQHKWPWSEPPPVRRPRRVVAKRR